MARTIKTRLHPRPWPWVLAALVLGPVLGALPDLISDGPGILSVSGDRPYNPLALWAAAWVGSLLFGFALWLPFQLLLFVPTLAALRRGHWPWLNTAWLTAYGFLLAAIPTFGAKLAQMGPHPVVLQSAAVGGLGGAVCAMVLRILALRRVQV